MAGFSQTQPTTNKTTTPKKHNNSNCAFKDVSGAPRYYPGYTGR
jgi:hypothetical protein